MYNQKYNGNNDITIFVFLKYNDKILNHTYE